MPIRYYIIHTLWSIFFIQYFVSHSAWNCIIPFFSYFCSYKYALVLCYSIPIYRHAVPIFSISVTKQVSGLYFIDWNISSTILMTYILKASWYWGLLGWKWKGSKCYWIQKQIECFRIHPKNNLLIFWYKTST